MIDLSLDVAAIRQKQNRLQLILGLYPRWLIAYSGGVDSTYLLAEATSLLGRSTLGVIADSPSLPRKTLSSAIAVAQNLGAQLRVIRTGELAKPEYAANPHDALELRPGAEAATEFKVRSPLREAGLTKAEIRWLSRERNLPTADQPAQPCLSSRIPHGTPVTREALLMVENAEDRLRAEGFRVFRVRYNIAKDGAITAKLQVDPSELARLYRLTTQLERDLRLMGFSGMLIDPIGYQPPKRAGKVISDQ